MAAAAASSPVLYTHNTSLVFPDEDNAIRTYLRNNSPASTLRSVRQKKTLIPMLQTILKGQTCTAKSVENVIILSILYAYPQGAPNLNICDIYTKLRVGLSNLGSQDQAIEHPDVEENWLALNGRIRQLFEEILAPSIDQIPQDVLNKAGIFQPVLPVDDHK